MRAVVLIGMATILVACAVKEDGFVDARDACFAVGKSTENVVLTTSSMQADISGVARTMVVYSWPAEEHGENYVCKVNVSKKQILEFTKNGIPVLDNAPEKLRTF